MADLELAIACIQAMKENKTYRGEKIGVIRKPIKGINSFEQGEAVVYREGEHLEKDEKTLMIASPMTPEQIRENREKGSLITTYNSTVCVPREYVMDVNN
jgi:hypothetical protein